MPRYHFNFENSKSAIADLVGRDLPNCAAARTEAAKIAADLATNHAIEGRLPPFQWIEVVDDCERAVVRLPVAKAVQEPNRLR
jgi:hypothetical protein